MKMLDTYRSYRAMRALRLADSAPNWVASPTRPGARLRQSWCFLTAHRMTTFSAIAEDSGHMIMVELCVRCGLKFTYCMECTTEGAE